MSAKGVDASTVTFAENWAIYKLYVRQEYDECLRKVEEQLQLCNGLCEYAVFVKGMMKTTCIAHPALNCLLSRLSCAMSNHLRTHCWCCGVLLPYLPTLLVYFCVLFYLTAERILSWRLAGLIKRKQGDVQGSLQLFQAATCLNPQNIENLKQVARSLYVHTLRLQCTATPPHVYRCHRR